MSVRTSARIVHLLFEALNAHDAARAARCIHPSYHGLDATRSVLTMGRENALAEIRAGLTAFPDLTFTVEQCVAEPQNAFVYWSMEATHEASFLNLPTTHRSVSVSGTALFTIEDEHIVHAVHLWDLAGLMRTAGLLPGVETGGA